jgi:hypothetical protein
VKVRKPCGVAGDWLFDDGLADVLKGSVFLSVRARRAADKVGWQGWEGRYKIVPVLVQTDEQRLDAPDWPVDARVAPAGVNGIAAA